MKFKTISRSSTKKLDEDVSKFLEGKKLHSIQFSTATYGDGVAAYVVFIMYDD